MIDYWNEYQQIFISFVQEFISVAFQLICLSRLGTEDILSNLVLFLTLIIFAGPYLNTWITFIHHICIKQDLKKYFPTAIVILVMHLCGALLASAIVNGTYNSWAKNIIWKAKPAYNPIHYTNITENGAQTSIVTASEFNWWVDFFEEMTAVVSLLIGCAYLFWLKHHEKIEERIQELKKNGDTTPYFDINFFLRLTLLVAAVSRAFPSAHLSFHISVYLRAMEIITMDKFWAHFCGGLFGLIITVVLVEMRKYVYKKTPPARGPESLPILSTSVFTDPTINPKDLTDSRQDILYKQNRYAPLRVSLHGGNYL
jgi:hypothetical protein